MHQNSSASKTLKNQKTSFSTATGLSKNKLQGILGGGVKGVMQDTRQSRLNNITYDFEPLIMELIMIPFNKETTKSVLIQMHKDKDPDTLTALLVVSLC
jgi:hypothetical protein